MAQVQIKNLSRKTTKGDIKKRLRQFHVLDVKLVYLSQGRSNIAYIHLPDRTTAQQVKDAVHNKLEIDGCLLQATMKGDYRVPYAVDILKAPEEPKKAENVHSEPENVHSEPENVHSEPEIDTRVVEVLVYDKETLLTDAEVKQCFEKYGELADVATVQEDYPRTVEVRYTSDLSAHAARYASPHAIQKATLIALPLPEVSTTLEDLVTTKELTCDPLVFSCAKRYLPTSLFSDSQVKIIAGKNRFIVHFEQPLRNTTAEKGIIDIIRNCEAEIDKKEIEQSFHLLPVLAEPKFIEDHLSDVTEPFDIKIIRGHKAATLEELAKEYSIKQGDLVGTTTFQDYLKKSTLERHKAKYQWSWQDDDKNFHPYTEEVTNKIERSFERKANFIQEIMPFLYIINTVTKTQTNTTTGKSRPLQRKQISEETLVFTLQIRARQRLINFLHRKINKAIQDVCIEANIEVPETAMQSNSFHEAIGQIRKDKLIQVTMDQDKSATLSIHGKPIIVKTAEVELHKTILKLVAEKSFHVIVPSSWEPQSSKCELKAVSRGTPEWNSIQDQMVTPDFRVTIKKIERIQNTWLWELYQLSKKRMFEKNDGQVNEKTLFHGTRLTSPKDIYDSEQGFDNRLASKGLWGEGTYFAERAEYSDCYAHDLRGGQKQMFLAQVITGVAFKASASDQNIKAPPKKSDHYSFFSQIFRTNKSKFEGERYDSITATTKDTKIYIIYELGRVYPSYLITYST